ncbi:DUF6408 family protein [Streptomyces hygroscopicus]|uniref:DUF6408 family protein n=1 Tax=Streptomyces hygroscopicus TaxID=1912 RepID=UPI0036972B1E
MTVNPAEYKSARRYRLREVLVDVAVSTRVVSPPTRTAPSARRRLRGSASTVQPGAEPYGAVSSGSADPVKLPRDLGHWITSLMRAGCSTSATGRTTSSEQTWPKKTCGTSGSSLTRTSSPGTRTAGSAADFARTQAIAETGVQSARLDARPRGPARHQTPSRIRGHTHRDRTLRPSLTTVLTSDPEGLTTLCGTRVTVIKTWRESPSVPSGTELRPQPNRSGRRRLPAGREVA